MVDEEENESFLAYIRIYFDVVQKQVHFSSLSDWCFVSLVMKNCAIIWQVIHSPYSESNCESNMIGEEENEMEENAKKASN